MNEKNEGGGSRELATRASSIDSCSFSLALRCRAGVSSSRTPIIGNSEFSFSTYMYYHALRSEVLFSVD